MTISNLEEACPPVQVEVDVLDLPELGELVVDVILLRLLVDPGHKQDPALDRPLRARLTLTQVLDII